jgi:hypothetical protein
MLLTHFKSKLNWLFMVIIDSSIKQEIPFLQFLIELGGFDNS